MGTLRAFYVQPQGALTLVTLQRRFPAIALEPSPTYIGLYLPEEAAEPPTAFLAALSAELATSVIWLCFQSVVEAFEFHHWQGGNRGRSLVYGCYTEAHTWEQVEGQPEPWERQAFFSPEALAQALEAFPADTERQELERLWRQAELRCGQTVPSVDAKQAAEVVARFYHLPGWA